MSGMEQIFIGLTLVGIGLTTRVVVDSLRHIDGLKQKLKAFCDTAEQCREMAAQEEAQVREVKASVEDLKKEIKALEEKENRFHKKVQILKKKVERRSPGKFKVGVP